ncbi:multiple sugar transport system ATP-binding protein [Actinomadura pelletieri DSM 43383]|uniref:Multiple sugar transport system ATP-binding protein n=1 Tax=Actinomadura pelletieri DSM 43383 TaxID=1120940 RepID=A0A495QTX1_9ACTN|nr:sn-glycerol-3-phosphate ABC transporter ATP-binding protein UgpC [Actinomadura pelletieri]RKS76964.1 multiple sugar transport system ATP-binding protein [Actinomadura pelletieri DSM 43383]
MGTIDIRGLGKVYPGGTRALRDLNLEIADGEFMIFVGPSGCGKTTALRMIAGLETIEEGEISIGGTVVNRVEPRKRDVAMVFQNYALYPHMTVYDNIAFPLQCEGRRKAEIKERVEEAARLLGLGELLRRKPRALSGGQRQRVAMGRAIVRKPQAFLLDEPLSNLDAKLRMQMRAELSTVQRTLGVTTVYVTHDQVESMTMGTRIAVLRGGLLQQEGTPELVYSRPANMFVATFIGSPGMNLLSCPMVSDAPGDLHCVVGDQRIPVPAKSRGLLERFAGKEIVLGVRPEKLTDAPARANGTGRLRGEVTVVEMLGHERLIQVEVPGRPVAADPEIENTRRPDRNGSATPGTVTVYARFSPSSTVKPTETVDIPIDPTDLHFFDPETGEAIR